MSKNMLDGGQVIVDYLVREKVPYVFGLCGHGNIGFLDALYERSDDNKTVSVHHESVAGFMADEYDRIRREPTATFPSCVPGSPRSGQDKPELQTQATTRCRHKLAPMRW